MFLVFLDRLVTHCVNFEGTVQQKLGLDEWHEILIRVIRQVQSAKKSKIQIIEI